MSDFWLGIVVAVGSNGLLLALLGFWLQQKLQRHEKQLEKMNSVFQTQFDKYHVDAVDAIVKTYGLLVDVHNSVFMYCFPDWDGSGMSDAERKKKATESMVVFYEYFRKHQIFMDAATVAEFEKSFRFLQQVYLKKDVPDLDHVEKVNVAISIYADMHKTLPGMLQVLQAAIKKRIEPEQGEA
jgi:hypothetical protein